MFLDDRNTKFLTAKFSYGKKVIETIYFCYQFAEC
jgi:hypothetical protein